MTRGDLGLYNSGVFTIRSGAGMISSGGAILVHTGQLHTPDMCPISPLTHGLLLHGDKLP